ncbi:AMP-binding domain-containing protein [Trichostrongylus colubriformis]|uniref:AMP-binding domain-containing protein n=1 Tax=Trichostrongylus colubriformis TaxID=6319 RepID=A0AAN8IQ49_TRICO
MVDYPLTPFHLQILQNSELYGDDIALTDDDGDVSFREVYQQSFQFAALQHSVGLRKGDPILIAVLNSSWYPVLFLGAAVIGCPLSGISHDSTSEEILYYFEQSRAKAVICTAENFAKLEGLLPLQKILVLCSTEERPEFPLGAVVLPHDLPQWNYHLPSLFRDIHHEPDDTLLLPFSSGTGGKPRCVNLTHRNYSAATAILKT